MPYLIFHLLRMLLLKYPNQIPEPFDSKMTFTMLMQQQTNKTKQNKNMTILTSKGVRNSLLWSQI